MNNRRPFVREGLLALLLFWSGSALGASIFEPGDWPELDASMERHGRQFYFINAHPFGMSLDAAVKDEPFRELVEDFLSQTESDDVRAVTGLHPNELLAAYGEYGDLGFFGGVALAGTVYEYLTLRRDGGPAERLERVRARVVRAAESLHVFYVVGGPGGIVARAIRRRVPEDPSDPPIPAVEIELTPLFDEEGNPLPMPKNNGTYRPDNSGGVLPEGVWSWKDSCSKDQLVGQVWALVSLYEAMKDDPDIDQSLVERLADDARGVADMLMTEHEIDDLEGPTGRGTYDLMIWDADGRPTFHHDLHPSSVEKIYAPIDSGVYNVFNMIMGMGVIRGLLHVTGDERIERYYYEELLERRGYLDKLQNTLDAPALNYIYAGLRTNFDNPDMTAVALWLTLYTDPDAVVQARLRRFLEEDWWLRSGETHTARLAKQPLWHAIYLTLTDRGTDQGLTGELADLLMGFDLGPYWHVKRENCDAGELAAGVCLAVDGETMLTIEGTDDRGRPMATEALHPSIRPPSNFDARSNPFNVNGGGRGFRLNPGGDLQTSYWIARHMERVAAGKAHISPLARQRAFTTPGSGLPTTAEPPAHDAGTSTERDSGVAIDVPASTDASGRADARSEPSGDDLGAPAATDVSSSVAEPEPETDEGGGGCTSTTQPAPAALFLALLLAACVRRRRREMGARA